MENRFENHFDVKLKEGTFHFITANTAFYQFLGDRLYCTLNMLMHEDDVQLFNSRIEKRDIGNSFVLHLADELGDYYEFVSCIKAYDEAGNIDLLMTEINSLYKENILLKNEVTNCISLLSQYKNICFEYDRTSDSMICFQYKPEKKELVSILLDDAYKKIQEELDEAEKRKIDNLVTDLRNGSRNFHYCIAGNSGVLENCKNGLEICGTAIYQNGVHIRTVGNISKMGAGMFGEGARKDQLTGLILKEDITNLAKNRIDVMKKKTTIAIIDIDDFKSVNDTFGHMKGDEVLRKCASIIQDEVEGYGSAGRIGGDEFFIVLDAFEDVIDLRGVLRSIKNSVLNAYTMEKDGFCISTSIGCATYPSDIDNFNDLFTLADYLLYRAKSKGKNRYILYEEEKHGKVEDILSEGTDNIGISSRKGLSKSEIVCKIADNVITYEGYSIENIFNDIVDYFGVERIVLYSLDKKEVVFQCGDRLMTKEQIEETCDYIVDESLQKMYTNGILVINNIKKIENVSNDAYEKLKKQGVLSFMHHNVTGKSKERYVVSYEAVVVRNTWNMEDMHFFRLFDTILERCL